MRIWNKTLIALALVLSITAFEARAYQDGDFQIWHTEDQAVSLTKPWNLAIQEEFRYGDNASELYYQHYEAGITYDVNKNFSMGAFYRQIYEGEKGKFLPEFQPRVEFTPKLDMFGFRLENRNRFLYKLYDDNRADIVEYRGKLLLKSPWKFTKLNIQPFVADEIFVWLNTVWLRRNRFDAGVSVDLLKNVKGEIYYRLQSTKKSGRWTDYNILGFKLKAAF